MLPVAYPAEKCHNRERPQEACGLREQTLSLWVAGPGVQELDEMRRVPPFSWTFGTLRPPFLSHT